MNWVYIYRKQKAKIYHRRLLLHHKTPILHLYESTWIYHLPERKHVVLRCWRDKVWTSSTPILYGNGVIYNTSQCLHTADKFQTLLDIIGNTQATIDYRPHKTICARPSSHRHEPRTANTRWGDTCRDCPAWRRQILNPDTSPNYRHGFTSQHEQDYNQTEQGSYWHLITLTVPCVITVLACVVYSLRSYTHKIMAHCVTRQNTSSQNATEPNPVHETSRTNSDKNAPDAKSYERHVFSVRKGAARSQASCSFAKSAVPKNENQHQTRYRVQITTTIWIRA